tara:strand:+ start:195 stop:629 length:435 start_codon:yes stop_codon:yes gene_type:complete
MLIKANSGTLANILAKILEETKDEILFLEEKPLFQIKKFSFKPKDYTEILSDIIVELFVKGDWVYNIGPETPSYLIGRSSTEIYKYRNKTCIYYALRNRIRKGGHKLIQLLRGYRNFGTNNKIQEYNMSRKDFSNLYRRVGELY